jgi:hypothetical protein
MDGRQQRHRAQASQITNGRGLIAFVIVVTLWSCSKKNRGCQMDGDRGIELSPQSRRNHTCVLVDDHLD